MNSTSKATFTNCVFTNNSAFNDTWDRSDGNGYGGAINVTETSEVVIEGGRFSGNNAWRGGALRLGASGSQTITGATFENNGSGETTRGGGLAYVTQKCTFTDCMADGNEAKYGGAIHIVNAAMTYIRGGTFQNNVATGDGGAICVDSGGCRLDVNRNVEGKTTYFLNNSAPSWGGAIDVESQKKDKTNWICNSVFKGNHGGLGGALYVRGGDSSNNRTQCYLNGCTFGGPDAADANYAHKSDNKGDGGVVYLDRTSYFTITDCSIKGSYADRFAGAIYVSNTSGNCLIESCDIDGCYANYGGAICSSSEKHVEIKVSGGSIKNCHAKGGGAILERGKENSILRVVDRNGSGTLFEGNYALENSGSNQGQGGAIKTENTNCVLLYTAIFKNNHAGAGGAIYSSGSSIYYIDECSFDSNYITYKWGTTIYAYKPVAIFLNNSSIGGAYTTNGDPSDVNNARPAWVYIEESEGVLSVSNSTIVGDPQYFDGSSYTPLTGNNTCLFCISGEKNYFTNSIVAPVTSSVHSVTGDYSDGREKAEFCYFHYNSVDGITATDNGGNTTGNTKADIDGLAWTANTSSTGGDYWAWNGTFGGVAPALVTSDNVKVLLETICTDNSITAGGKDFVGWCGGDFHYDQRHVSRGTTNDVPGPWWPGAYQAN